MDAIAVAEIERWQAADRRFAAGALPVGHPPAVRVVPAVLQIAPGENLRLVDGPGSDKPVGGADMKFSSPPCRVALIIERGIRCRPCHRKRSEYLGLRFAQLTDQRRRDRRCASAHNQVVVVDAAHDRADLGEAIKQLEDLSHQTISSSKTDRSS